MLASVTSRAPAHSFIRRFQRILLRLSEPPPTIRFKAPGAVKQAESRSLAAVRDEFLGWQDRLAERLREADGLDLRKARHRSPMPGWRWTLGTFFAITLAHERRHIWRREESLRKEPAFPKA